MANIYTTLLSINKYAFYVYGFHMIVSVSRCYFLNSINQQIFIMEDYIFFEERVEFFNIILMSFGYKELT